MDNKKRLMFILEDDYYYITIKVISILLELECNKNEFKDYRKLSLIMEFIKTEQNINLLEKATKYAQLENKDREKIINIICNAKINISVIKRILFFLEKQNIIYICKTISKDEINVKIYENERLYKVLTDDIINEDRQLTRRFKEIIPRVRILKNSTLIQKISEITGVNIWQD